MGVLSKTSVSYGAATAVGLLAVAYGLPVTTLAGGGLFQAPYGDLATNLIGHLAFQAPGWHWPLLNAPDLAWPLGHSVAMTDSNPLMSLLAKCLASLRGRPANLLGLWLAACVLLQPVTATYALLGMMRTGRNVLPAVLAASLLSLLMPEWLFRVIHINLLGQFLLLLALGLAIRACAARRTIGFAALLGLSVLSVLIHPYLFMFCIMVLAAPCLQAVLAGAPGGRQGFRELGLAALIAAGLFLMLNGGMGSGGPGFGLYSMDLLGPITPQRSGLFGADLPMLDATGFQHEGFNYLGAGVVALVVVAAIMAGRSGLAAAWRGYRGLIVVLLAMTALAVTPHVTMAGHNVLPIDCAWLARPFAVIRSSGRAFWVVGFALMLGAIALLAQRLRPPVLAAVLAAAVGLQWADTAPWRQTARAYLAGAGQIPPALAMPAGTELYRTVPVCDPAAVQADTFRLLALRQGARLADARLAHDPPDQVCAALRQDGLTASLLPGETRLFLPSVASPAPPAAAGGGVVCQSSPAGLLCHLPRSILGSTRPAGR